MIWAQEPSLKCVNSGIIYVPDSHPTPSASLSGFGVFFLGPFWSVWSVAFAALLARLLAFALLLHASCMRNDRRREVDDTSTPSIRFIITIVFKIPRILGVGRQERMTPFKMSSGAVHSSPLPSAVSQRVTRKGKWGSGNRTVTQMRDGLLAQIQSCLFRRDAPVSSSERF